MESKNSRVAQNALNLVNACQALIKGSIRNYRYLILPGINDEGVKETPPIFDQGIYSAFELAAKASRNRKLQYGIYKHFLSLQLVPPDPMTFWPYWNNPRANVNPNTSIHIEYSHALFAAYSTIEELGLEVRASAKEPSLVNGKWNEKVKADLEERLKKKNIDLSEPVEWWRRAHKTRITTAKGTPNGKKDSVFSKRKIVCEFIEVVDAINYSSWLRSKVAAHGTPQLAQSITRLEVANCQKLSRRLLLESMKLWNWEKISTGWFESGLSGPLTNERINSNKAAQGKTVRSQT